MSVGTLCIVEQAREYFGMQTLESQPTLHKPPPNIETMSPVEQSEVALKMLKDFVSSSNYLSFDIAEEEEQQGPTGTWQFFFIGVNIYGQAKWNAVYFPPPVPPKPDDLNNYTRNLCHWTLQLMELHDTAKEGDPDRLHLNCKSNMPLFFSHSKLTKYFVENLDFLMKTTVLNSPQVQSRILEGAFVNKHGGRGKNVEADLVQEHSVRNGKDLIRGLGANKTDKAIERVTLAADHVEAVCRSFNDTLSMRRSSGRHSKKVSQDDLTTIQNVFKQVRPFHVTPGRSCLGFAGIKANPTDKINKAEFTEFLENNITRILRGMPIDVDEEEEDDAENEHDLPEI